MTTTGDVLSPLPYADVPATKSPVEDGSGERGLDDGSTATRELEAAFPPAQASEAAPGLMGSPMGRISGPHGDGGRGLEADPTRPPAFPDDEARSRELPDITMPEPPRAEPKAPAADPDTEREIKGVITAQELAALKQEISALYQSASSELAGTPAKVALALGWLSEARTIALGQPGRYPTAELRVGQTRALLEQYRLSHSAGTRNARGLVIANIVWLLLFAGLFFLDQWVQGGGAGTTFRAISTIFPPWLCVLAGGMGGALGALVALGRAVGQREYSADADLDYHLNALKGAILGGVAYYLILGGFVTAAATSGVELAGGADGSLMERIQAGAAESPLYIIIAFIAGLAQQRLLGLLGRIWSQRVGEGEPAPTSVNAELDSVPPPPAVPVVTSPAVEEMPPLPPLNEPLPPVAVPLPADNPAPVGGGLG